MQRFALALVIPFVVANPTFAEPAPPVSDPEITLISFGIYCKPPVIDRQEAPDTRLGYIDLLEGTPEIRFQQQEIPARLGVSFGVVVQSPATLDPIRIEVWQPGSTKSESWAGALEAGFDHYSGFSFDTPEELQLGLWRMEAWEGDRRLFSVEFDVVPPSTLPGASSDCDLLS